MSRSRLIRLTSAGLVVAALAGCSILSGGSKDPVTIYAPQVQVNVDPAWPEVSWQLVLAKPSASRMVDSPRINVRPAPDQLEVYKGVTWAQTSTDLVEDTLMRAFEDSGKIPGVARLATGIRADYKLSVDIRRLESDYRGAAVPAATIELNAKLIHTADQRVVASRTFLHAEQARSTAVGDVTSAFQTALQAMTDEMVGWTLQQGQADHLAQASTPILRPRP